MKYFNSILVVSLIFLLPAGSYLYLRSGFVFRKENLEELKNETPLSQDQRNYLISQDSTYFSRKDRIVNLIMKVNDYSDLKDLYFLAESMKERKDFELTAMLTDESLMNSLDPEYNHLYTRMYLNTSVNFFDQQTRFILLKDDNIRRMYGNSTEDFNKVYEQTVMLLPLKKRDKLTLIRDNEK